MGARAGRLRRAAALLGAAWLTACGPPSSRPGPTRHHQPIAPEAYESYLRGRLAYLGDNYLEAARLFALARQAAPDEPELAAAEIESLALADATPAALRGAERALARWPDNARIWFATGRAAYRGGDYLAAATAFERAIALDPAPEMPYLRLAQCYRRLDAFEREVQTYLRLLDAHPDSVRARFRLGARLGDLQQPEQAEPMLRAALELDPGHLGARIELARMLRTRGHPAAARAQLREAFDRGGGRLSTARRIFDTLRAADGVAVATATLRALDRDDLDLDVRVGLGYLLLDAADYGAALAVARGVLALAPDDPGARTLQALALLRYLSDS